MPKMFFKSLCIGLKRRWKAGITQAFGVAGAIWLVTEIITKVSTLADHYLTEHGDLYTGGVLVAAIFRLLSYCYETRSVSFAIPTTDTTITIQFGDIFQQQTDWLVGVNEFFDGELGHMVAQESLHGKFITYICNGSAAQFRSMVDEALKQYQGTSTDRQSGPMNSYEIGTTAVVNIGSHKAFLVAMSKTDLITAKASSTVPLLWTALQGALLAVNSFGNGAPLSLPLLGNGRSSVNVEPQHLMRLIVLALVDFGRKHGLPKQVLIIAHEACFEALDIREIKRDWSKK